MSKFATYEVVTQATVTRRYQVTRPVPDPMPADELSTKLSTIRHTNMMSAVETGEVIIKTTELEAWDDEAE